MDGQRDLATLQSCQIYTRQNVTKILFYHICVCIVKSCQLDVEFRHKDCWQNAPLGAFPRFLHLVLTLNCQHPHWHYPLYSSSVTGSSQLTTPFSVLMLMAMCTIGASGEAPCQCLTPGSIFIVPPVGTCCTGLPSSW